MLIQLNIKNFALIESATVNFETGFSILSGETGAGKSILIDAINFVLGGKFSKNIIRTGEKKTYVEGIFSIESKKVESILEELSIEYDDVLIISREFHQSGKNLVKINGKSLILSQLKKIRTHLIDIHGQHQNQSLLEKSNHIVYLDEFIGKDVLKLLKQFKSLKQELSKIRDDLNRINGDQDREKLLDYLKFQIEDIEKANLKIGEEEDLEEEFNVLSNAEKIKQSLSISYALLDGNEELSIVSGLSKVVQELSNVEIHFEKIKSVKNIIEESFYNIEEAMHEIRDMNEEIVFDNFRLEKLNERIYDINQYKKKYGSSIEEIFEYLSKIQKQYDELINSEKIIEELNSKEKEVLKKMENISLNLHELREKYSINLEKRILAELEFIGLNKSRINIKIDREKGFNERGFDDVSILISTNPGEPLMPLEKVLSGGELSRIMLALKCVFAEKDQVPTLIFDEIDTGISGAVAQRVGEKMYELSKLHQVICITHLPQIAIFSDQHYFIMKQIKNEKTFTNVKVLSKEEKEIQISEMMVGDDITETSINNVKEMIKSADIKKKQIKN